MASYRFWATYISFSKGLVVRLDRWFVMHVLEILTTDLLGLNSEKDVQSRWCS